jgi:Zn-dependent peptidase ImmA (M78 family)
LDDDVSGFTINDREIGPFIVINKAHLPGRKRYSYAHEYAHVLMDRHAQETISRLSDRTNLIEIRANAFAAAFLMPEGGVRQFLSSLGKDKQTRSRAEIFDGEGTVPVEIRTSSESNIKLYDVIQLAHHFAVSRQAILYRLLNLKLITQAEHEELAKQEISYGKKLATLMFLGDEPKDVEKIDSMSRFLSLALEALRRDEISMSKFKELAAMTKLSKSHIQELLSTALKNAAT